MKPVVVMENLSIQKKSEISQSTIVLNDNI